MYRYGSLDKYVLYCSSNCQLLVIQSPANPLWRLEISNVVSCSNILRYYLGSRYIFHIPRRQGIHRIYPVRVYIMLMKVTNLFQKRHLGLFRTESGRHCLYWTVLLPRRQEWTRRYWAIGLFWNVCIVVCYCKFNMRKSN